MNHVRRVHGFHSRHITPGDGSATKKKKPTTYHPSEPVNNDDRDDMKTSASTRVHNTMISSTARGGQQYAPSQTTAAAARRRVLWVSARDHPVASHVRDNRFLYETHASPSRLHTRARQCDRAGGRHGVMILWGRGDERAKTYCAGRLCVCACVQ